MATSRRFSAPDRTDRTQTVPVVLHTGQTIQFELVPGQAILTPGQNVLVFLAPDHQVVLAPGQVVLVTLGPNLVIVAPVQVVVVQDQVFPIPGVVQDPFQEDGVFMVL